MKNFLMVLILIPFSAFNATTLGQGEKLDELLLKSGKIRQEGIRGFIVQQKPEPLIPPEILFKNITPPPPLPTAEPTGYVPYSTYLNDIRSYDQKISTIEVQLTKTTAILDNLTENSGDLKNSMDSAIKTIEALTALIVALGGLFGFLKLKKKNS